MDTNKYFNFNSQSISDRIFINRHKELQELRDSFQSAEQSFTQRFIIGLPGVGKTTLLKVFFSDLESVQANFFCICLKGKTIDGLIANTKSLVQTYALEMHSNPCVLQDNLQWASKVTSVIKTIRDRKLKESKGAPCTIVVLIKNVEIESDEYLKALSCELKQMKGIFLLATSGTQLNFGIKTEYIHLKNLDRDFSKELIKQALTPSPEEPIENFCEILSDFPMSLQQAISFVQQARLRGEEYTILKYVEDFKQPDTRSELIDHGIAYANKQANSIVLCLKLTTDKLEAGKKPGKLAIGMLKVLSWLDNYSLDKQDFKDIDGLEKLSSVEFANIAEKNKTHINAIRQLHNYGLIEVNEHKVELVMHQQLQSAAKLLFSDTATDTIEILLKNYSILKAYLKSTEFVEEVKECLKRMEKVRGSLAAGNEPSCEAEEKFLTYLEVCDKNKAVQFLKGMIQKYEGVVDFPTSKLVDLYDRLGRLYNSLRYYGEEIIVREQLREYIDDEGRLHEQALNNLYEMGKAYAQLDISKEAIRCLESVSTDAKSEEHSKIRFLADKHLVQLKFKAEEVTSMLPVLGKENVSDRLML